MSLSLYYIVPMEELNNSTNCAFSNDLPVKIKYEVHLVIYDFAKVNCALSSLGLGVYHTAVELKYP